MNRERRREPRLQGEIEARVGGAQGRDHRRASVDGQMVPMPINLDTVNKLYGLSLTSFEL